MYVFSKSTLSFYPAEMKEAYQQAGTWPDDGVEVSDEIFREFSTQPPAGRQRGADETGHPVWADIPVPDIDTARTAKIAAINNWRNDQENASYILNINSHDWDYSKITQQRLEMAVDIARQDRLPDGFFWTDAHNQDVPLTASQLLELNEAVSHAMFVKGLQIHIRQRQMKTDIGSLTDVMKILSYPVSWGGESEV